MSSGLQSAEVSSSASTVAGSTESANTHCPGNGAVKALSAAPIISIVDANTRMLHCPVALLLQRSYFSCAEFATCSRWAALRGGPFMLLESTRQSTGAAAQRTSMSAYFTSSLTAPRSLGLLASLRGGLLFRSGSAWPGRSQKDGLPTCRGRTCGKTVQGHQLAHREGQPDRCPFLIGSGTWTPRRACLLCSSPCRSSAQASSPGFWITLCWVRSFLRSV